LSPGFSTYQIIGPSALSEGFLPGVTSLTFTPELPHVVQPGGQQGTYWEYWVDVMEVSPFGRCGLLADTNTNGLHGLESALVAFVETTCRAHRDATF
jgi:hypothetical protein